MDHDHHDHHHEHGEHCDHADAGRAPAGQAAPPKVLSPAAQRALAEAAERRAQAEAAAQAAAKAQGNEHRAKEYNGPQGPEPTRYGDWERKGIASDF